MKKNFFNDKTKKKIKEKKFYIVLALCFLTISAIAFTNSITEKPKAPAENKNSDVLFHCFSGSVEFMKECTKLGYKIALGGVVTFKNAVKMKEVAKETRIKNAEIRGCSDTYASKY